MGRIAEHEKVRLVNAYQALEYRPSHPQLTCPHDGESLVAIERDSKAVLACLVCDYTSDEIPEQALLGDWVDPRLLEALESALDDEGKTNMETALAKRFAQAALEVKTTKPTRERIDAHFEYFKLGEGEDYPTIGVLLVWGRKPILKPVSTREDALRLVAEVETANGFAQDAHFMNFGQMARSIRDDESITTKDQVRERIESVDKSGNFSNQGVAEGVRRQLEEACPLPATREDLPVTHGVILTLSQYDAGKALLTRPGLFWALFGNWTSNPNS